MPIIQENVSNDEDNPTRVYTDGWAGYNGLSALGKFYIFFSQIKQINKLKNLLLQFLLGYDHIVVVHD